MAYALLLTVLSALLLWWQTLRERPVRDALPAAYVLAMAAALIACGQHLPNLPHI